MAEAAGAGLRGAAIWRAARSLIGTRFRLHGHDPRSGLDCVGLASVAATLAGARIDPPTRYALRGGDAVDWEAALRRAGLEPVAAGAHAVGDILLIAGGRDQLHLAVAGAASHIHAHRGLGRVVETPGAPAGTIAGRWRVAAARFAGPKPGAAG